MQPIMPFITVVMPVRNEARFIKETLRQVLQQEYPRERFEVIVVDGNSEDGTKQIAGQLAAVNPNVQVLDNPNKVPSSGRNIGFKKGRGDIFLVVDGHCHIADRALFQNIVRCFEKSGAECLGRPQPLDPPDLTDFQKSVAIARASKIGHSSDSFIYSNFEGYISPVSNGAAYRKEVFQKVGYVDERFDACEDVEFNYRVEKAGVTAYMSPSLAVKYFPRENLTGLFRQMLRYGRGRFHFVRKHPEAITSTTLVPPAFVMGIFLSLFIHASWLMVSSATPPPHHDVRVIEGASYSILGMLSLYFLLILSESIVLCFRHGLHHLKYLLIIFPAIHLGLGVGFIEGVLDMLTGREGR